MPPERDDLFVIFPDLPRFQRASREERTLLLSSGQLVRFRDGRRSEQPVERPQLRGVVRDVFGVELPETPLVFESYSER